MIVHALLSWKARLGRLIRGAATQACRRSAGRTRTAAGAAL